MVRRTRKKYSVCHRKNVDVHFMIDPLLKEELTRHCNKEKITYKKYLSRILAREFNLSLDKHCNVIDYETELKCIDKTIQELTARKQEIMEAKNEI